jgi:hypothetical protein
MRAVKPASKARVRYRLAEPRVSASAILLSRALGGAYVRAALKIKGVEFRHHERLVEAWRDHLEGRARLILAFRHAYGEEPQLLAHAFSSLLPRLARRSGAPLPGPARARFVHGYEVPLWSGPFVRWLLPRSGALPVYHVKYDKKSMDRIRQALREGPHPLALAPEGQISYRAETLPRLERGTMRLGFWCAEELLARGRSERVLVLPISIHYRFDEKGTAALEALVARVESALRLPRSAPTRGLGPEERKAALLSRLEAVDAALVSAAESYYGIEATEGSSRDERLAILLGTALGRAEAAFGLQPSGDEIDRVYRIRLEGWNRIYPESGLSPPGSLARRLEDRKAGEAWYVMRHMELVDLCHYLDSAYARGGEEDGGLSFDRLVETAYSAADMASRLAGGDISGRPSVLDRGAVISIARPLDLTARLGDYSTDKRLALDTATSDLETQYLESIKERIDERHDKNGIPRGR